MYIHKILLFYFVSFLVAMILLSMIINLLIIIGSEGKLSMIQSPKTIFLVFLGCFFFPYCFTDES